MSKKVNEEIDKRIKPNSNSCKLDSRTVDVSNFLTSDSYAHDIVYCEDWFTAPISRIVALEIANIERLVLRKGIEIDVNRLDGVLLFEALNSSIRMLMLHLYGGIYRRFNDLGSLSPGKSIALANQIGIPPKFLQSIIVALQPILIGKRVFIPNPNLFRSTRRFNEGSYKRNGASVGAPSTLGMRYGISWNSHMKTLLKDVYGIAMVDISNVAPRLNLSVRPIRFVKKTNLVVSEVTVEAKTDPIKEDGNVDSKVEEGKEDSDDSDSDSDSDEEPSVFEFLEDMNKDLEVHTSRYNPAKLNYEQSHFWDGGYEKICDRLNLDPCNYKENGEHRGLWYYPYARSEDNPRISFARRDFLYIDIYVGRLRSFYTGKQINRLSVDVGNIVPRGYNRFAFDIKDVLRSIFDRPGVLALGLQTANFRSTLEMSQELLMMRDSHQSSEIAKYGSLTVFATSFLKGNELEIVNHFKISANVVNVLGLEANMTIKEALFTYEATPES